MKNEINKKTAMIEDGANGISTMPLISVVIPCYNNGAYVGQAIESVLKQTYDNWELVIVNDGSTDNSGEVINQYAQADKRIHCVKQENRGLPAARNRGVQGTMGDYICFLDADDWLAPACLQRAIDNYKEHPDCRLFYLRSEIIDEQTGHKTPWIGYCGSYRSVLVYGMDCKIIIRKSDFSQIGGFDESLNKGCEDWEFNVRFLFNNCNVIISSDVLYYYRDHQNGTRMIDVEKENLVPGQSYLYKKNMEKYVKYLGSPIIQYQYEDRLLPRLCRKILNLRATIYNIIKG